MKTIFDKIETFGSTWMLPAIFILFFWLQPPLNYRIRLLTDPFRKTICRCAEWDLQLADFTSCEWDKRYNWMRLVVSLEEVQFSCLSVVVMTVECHNNSDCQCQMLLWARITASAIMRSSIDAFALSEKINVGLFIIESWGGFSLPWSQNIFRLLNLRWRVWETSKQTHNSSNIRIQALTRLVHASCAFCSCAELCAKAFKESLLRSPKVGFEETCQLTSDWSEKAEVWFLAFAPIRCYRMYQSLTNVESISFGLSLWKMSLAFRDKRDVTVFVSPGTVVLEQMPAHLFWW